MTNFEKILSEADIETLAEALSECFAGQCAGCPANGLCMAQEENDDVGCVDVLRLWLESEAEE